MRIGAISLNINTPDFNYGAMLHSWAFQQYLKKLDFVTSAEVIDYTMPVLEGQCRDAPFLGSLCHGRVKTACGQILRFPRYRERLKKFNGFVGGQLSVSKEAYTQKTLNAAKLNYDTVICESDVIWSPGFCGGHFDRSFFLALDSMKAMRRVAYAPSMADGTLREGQERELKSLLLHIDQISCRESYEKQILERLTDKKVTHVADPVLLLQEGDYAPILGEPLAEGRYILLYLPVDENAWLRACAFEYARSLKVIEISTALKKKRSGHYVCYEAAGIEDFLSAVKYAECVFTNSFHAICFSVIFHRDFYAFSRAYAGKVKDICHTLGAYGRYVPDGEGICEEEVDYVRVDRKWKEFRERSQRWLKNALISPGGGNIILVGLIYDANLGDQAIYESTRHMVEETAARHGMHLCIKGIDLYGRSRPDGGGRKGSAAGRAVRRLARHIWHGEGICDKVLKECRKKMGKETRAVIFVGGGLLKFEHQFLAPPVRAVLQYAHSLDIPVMLSAVGVEGFDEGNAECLALRDALNLGNVRMVTTRDDLELLRGKWLLRGDIRSGKVADPACALPDVTRPLAWSRTGHARGGKDGGARTVGLGIGRANLFSDYGAGCTAAQAKKLWAGLYRELTRRGYRCVLFTNGLYEDDAFAREALAEIHRHGYKDAVCLDRPRNVQELVDIIASLDGEIVTRLHASILGYAYHVPSVGLVWNRKQTMFGEAIRYPERFVTYDRFDAPFLADRIEAAMSEGYEPGHKERYASLTSRYIEQFLLSCVKT